MGRSYALQSFKSRRCKSKLLYGGVHGILSCIGERDHDGVHVGKTEGGLRITWTTKDSLESYKRLERDLVNKRTEPFIGWRIWDLLKGSKLKSVTSEKVWDKPVLRARGRPWSKLLKEENDGCFTRYHNAETYRKFKQNDWTDYGIYCYKNPSLLLDYLGIYITGIGSSGVRLHSVIGAIELTGRVVEHTIGYRAQVATFKELWVVPENALEQSFMKHVVKELEDRYQCPTHILDPKQVEHWARFYSEEEA